MVDKLEHQTSHALLMMPEDLTRRIPRGRLRFTTSAIRIRINTMADKNTIRFSIIVPTYNSAGTLVKLLDSLAQSDADTETLVMDDASMDGTPELAAKYPVRYERLPVNSGPAEARNRGAALAFGEWLVFADADTIFAPDTVAQIRDIVDSADADALVGSYTGTPANDGFVARFKALWDYVTIDMTLIRPGQRLIPHTTWAPRPGVVRRTAFERIGGFDTRFRGADLEDMELGYRLVENGFRIYFVPELKILHHYPDTLLRELRPFARRCAVWIRMNRGRKKLDTAGEASPRQALGHLCGFAAPVFAVAGLLWPPAWIAAAGAIAGYAATNHLFLSMALEREGIVFAVKALGMCWLRTVVSGFAVAYALATLALGRK